jgi:hypothetical protein
MAIVKFKRKDEKKELPKIVGVLKAQVKPECTLVYNGDLGITVNLEVKGLLPEAVKKLIECTDEDGFVTLDVVAPLDAEKDGKSDNDS